MKHLITIFALIMLIILATEESKAIPAFARKYNLSCQTCHSPMPRLKAYGDDFAGNALALTDKESPRYFTETGDEELSLIRDFPVAVRMDLYGSYNYSNQEKADFGTPYLLKFLSGGSLAKDIAYYFYFFFSERGEVAGIEDAYVMFNNLLGIDLDLYVGQFQISDPLFKRELRLSLDDYNIYKLKVGLSNSNLAYDRGLMLTLGLDTGTDIIFEVLNGNGIGEPDNFRIFDKDKHKSFFGRVSQEITDFLRIGAFGYFGKEDLAANTAITTAEYLLAGPDVTLAFNDLVELNCQYVYRSDDKTFLTTNDINPTGKIETNGGFAELIITPNGDNSKVYGSLLFNYIDSDLKELKQKSGTFHIGYLLRRNIRLIGEYTFTSTEEKDYSKVILGIVTAF